jgi:hypothetical protein
MDGWFRIWWRQVGKDDDHHSITLYRAMIHQWNNTAERCFVRGAVFERRGIGEDGQQISEICVHRDALFVDDHTGRDVFISPNQDEVRTVEVFWKARSLKTFGDESHVRLQWSDDNDDIEHSVSVSAALLNAYPFTMTPPRRMFET